MKVNYIHMTRDIVHMKVNDNWAFALYKDGMPTRYYMCHIPCIKETEDKTFNVLPSKCSACGAEISNLKFIEIHLNLQGLK